MIYLHHLSGNESSIVNVRLDSKYTFSDICEMFETSNIPGIPLSIHIKNFVKFKELQPATLFNFIQKETPAQVFSYEFCKILTTSFLEHFPGTACDSDCCLKKIQQVSNFLLYQQKCLRTYNILHH